MLYDLYMCFGGDIFYFLNGSYRGDIKNNINYICNFKYDCICNFGYVMEKIKYIFCTFQIIISRFLFYEICKNIVVIGWLLVRVGRFFELFMFDLFFYLFVDF